MASKQDMEWAFGHLEVLKSCLSMSFPLLFMFIQISLQLSNFYSTTALWHAAKWDVNKGDGMVFNFQNFLVGIVKIHVQEMYSQRIFICFIF